MIRIDSPDLAGSRYLDASASKYYDIVLCGFPMVFTTIFLCHASVTHQLSVELLSIIG